MLAVFVNFMACGLALLTLLLYVLCYTPLKSRTTLNTIVGAVVGAIPPLIGWVAERTNLQHGFLVAVASSVAFLGLVIAHYLLHTN